MSQPLDEEAVFHIARQIPKPEARSGYLDQICAGDQALRHGVETMLAAHEQNDSFLKSATPTNESTNTSLPLIARAPSLAALGSWMRSWWDD